MAILLLARWNLNILEQAGSMETGAALTNTQRLKN